MTDVLRRLTVAIAEQYRIERELGAGGMATVYLAHDLKHDRDVAIKVLHPDLGAALGGERFLAEIKTTAKLQHPHILPLLDSGTADGLLFYVMPFVDGETLRSRLDREKQLPVNDAVQLAREVADALQYAHERGVIHRDIKPENILLQGGTGAQHALVADFGIALAVQSAGGARMTQTGLSLGTPQYMSPEQATGERIIDARSDLYALAAVSYEMLVGEPPFTGPTVQSIVARLMTEEPRALMIQRKAIPEHVEAAVLKALEKLPADRFTTAAEFAGAIDARDTTIASRATSSRNAAKPQSRVNVGLITATVLASSVAAWSFFRPVPAPQVVRYALLADSVPGSRSWTGDIAISPDGHTIIRAGGPRGTLLVRHRDELKFAPLAGSEGAIAPRVTPDGLRVLFYVNGQLVSMPLTGGALRVEADSIVAIGGGVISDDGWLYFDVPSLSNEIRRKRVGSQEPSSSISRVDSANGEAAHLLPEPIPGGKHVLFSTESRDGVRRVAIGDVNTRTHHVLIEGVRIRPLGADRVVYSTRDGRLWVTSIDAAAGKLVGEPRLIGENIPTTAIGPVDFDISASGTLVYSVEPAGQRRSLVWLSRSGVRSSFDSSWTVPLQSPAISPDGQRVAVSVASGVQSHVWLKSIRGGAATQLTTEKTAVEVAWRPDGRAVSFISGARNANVGDIYETLVSGEGNSRRIAVRNGELSEQTWTPDGRILARTTTPAAGAGDLYVSRAPGDTTLVPVITTPHSEYSPSLSPDGKWMAFTSNETRRLEVFVTRTDNPSAGKWPVSASGGFSPRWSPKGDEIFFLDLSGRLAVATVRTAPTFAVERQKVLFDARDFVQPAHSRRNFDVTADGQRFLFVERADGGKTGSMIVVENFIEELKRPRTP